MRSPPCCLYCWIYPKETYYSFLASVQFSFLKGTTLVAGGGLEPPGPFDTRLWASLATNYWLSRYICGEGWNRTTGTRRFKPLLYQLSYRTIICSLVVDSNSRFTILSQQVNALYEFPVSYNHNIFNISKNLFSLFVLQRYIIYFNLPNFFKLFLYPRWDSNSYWMDFKSNASTDWATGMLFTPLCQRTKKPTS